MSDRGGAQSAIIGRQEDEAQVGQAVHDQLGGVLQELVPVLGGGQQVAGVQQELEPVPGPLGRGAGGPFPGLQLAAFAARPAAGRSG